MRIAAMQAKHERLQELQQKIGAAMTQADLNQIDTLRAKLAAAEAALADLREWAAEIDAAINGAKTED